MKGSEIWAYSSLFRSLCLFSKSKSWIARAHYWFLHQVISSGIQLCVHLPRQRYRDGKHVTRRWIQQTSGKHEVSTCMKTQTEMQKWRFWAVRFLCFLGRDTWMWDCDAWCKSETMQKQVRFQEVGLPNGMETQNWRGKSKIGLGKVGVGGQAIGGQQWLGLSEEEKMGWEEGSLTRIWIVVHAW